MALRIPISFFRSRYADVSDHPDHDGRYNQGDGHKRDQHVTDDIDDICDGGHQSTHHVRIRDHLIVHSFRLHAAVVCVQDLGYMFFAVKVDRVDADFTRIIKIHISQ